MNDVKMEFGVEYLKVCSTDLNSGLTLRANILCNFKISQMLVTSGNITALQRKSLENNLIRDLEMISLIPICTL